MSPLFVAVRHAALLCLPSATLLASLALCACAQQPGGHAWTVTSTQEGTWSDVLVNKPEPDKPESGTWPVGPFVGGGGYRLGGTNIRNSAADGTVTSALTWTPAAGKTLLTDPAPDPLFVLEYGYARWASVWGNSPSPPTQADAVGASVADGFGDLPVFAPGNTTAISSGYRLEQRGFSSGSWGPYFEARSSQSLMACRLSPTVKAGSMAPKNWTHLRSFSLFGLLKMG